MDSGLKRIEATLDRLNTRGAVEQPQYSQEYSQAAGSQRSEWTSEWTKVDAALQKHPERPSKTYIQAFPLPKTEPPASELPASESPAQKPVAQSAKRGRSAKPGSKPSSKPGSKASTKAKRITDSATKSAAIERVVQPFPAAPADSEALNLPKAKPPSFSSHRHAVNPNLSVGLLKEIESVVLTWQMELEQTVLEIQALYVEGPIVDGWLESHPYGSPQSMQAIGTATLRHAEIERLMEYVEEICRMPQTLDLGEAPRTGYQLCGLDAEGKLWSRPCPSQQVPYVSLAIARYQKLRILLARKQNLESRLTHLVQSLTLLHGQMQDQT